MVTKGVRRLPRPKQIPERLWREWTGDTLWKKAVTAFLTEHTGEEFTCAAIRKATGLKRPILTERLLALRRRIARSNATVELIWREDNNNVFWCVQKREKHEE